MKWAAFVLALAAAGCSDPANTQRLPIGSRCGSNGDCGTAPYACAVSGYPFGYCEKSCTTDGDCPLDSMCSPIVKSCRRLCSPTMVCRTEDGYSCQAAGGRTVCEASAPMDGGTP